MLTNPRPLGRFALTAALISVNWVLYIWSINAGHTVDASLGYFINPLVNVLVGALLFRERLRLGQKLPLVLAAARVRRIPFSLTGILQYLAPTLQWLTGIYLFHEAFDPHKAVGFGLIWLAPVVYGAESVWYGWRQRAPA